MNRIKIIYAVLCLLVGYILFLLILDIASKPSNIGVSHRPIESLETYFFGFVWVMGNIGWVLGSILLIGFLTLFYFLGILIYEKRHSIIKQ